MDTLYVWQSVFENFGNLVMLCTKPLGEMFTLFSQVPMIKDWSIMGLLGYGLLSFLGLVLVFHAIRLFIGG